MEPGDRFAFNGRELSVNHKELSLTPRDDRYYLYLRTIGPELGFDLWELELAGLASPEALDGRRVHVRYNGERFEDDSLGSGCCDLLDLNLVWFERKSYDYDEVQIDFRRVKDNRYRIDARFVVIKSLADRITAERHHCEAHCEITVAINIDGDTGG